MNSAPAAKVLEGLFAPHKSLPTWLLYDDAGCVLFERITTLPEYYLTRAELNVFARHSKEILAHAAQGGAAFALAELGAGSAKKTELLISAALRRQRSCTYLACDIAPGPLAAAASRLKRTCPGVEVKTFVGTHLEAGPAIAALTDRQVLLFLGSSIGNFPDPEAIELLAGMTRFLREDALLVLGMDLKKDPRVLVPAYNDAQGITAAFTMNVLTRLNREYGCNFQLNAFRHVAEWIEASSSIEISLEAQRHQRVLLGAVEREITFADGERIHLETCVKYDEARVESLLRSAGFRSVARYLDAKARYAVQIASVASPGSR